MVTKAILAHRTGSPDVFSYEDMEIGIPGEGEVLIKHHAIGVNFIDTYFRSGVYPWKEDMPILVGAEASGEVIEKHESVTELSLGDRIAYTLPNGAYCKHRIVPANRLVKLPGGISYEIAAAVMLKGLTVQYLLHRTFALQPEHKVLFHAAAGGVGLLAGQWGSTLGATMIGTVSTEEKAELAKENGYSQIIIYTKEDFVEKTLEFTKGEGVDVVYDSVGKDTYPGSLKCLKRLGHWVSFGQSSGLLTDFQLGDLAAYGSITATRPTLFHYIFTKEELRSAAYDLFQAILNNDLKVHINDTFPLAEAAKVHVLLEGRMTKGSTVLIP